MLKPLLKYEFRYYRKIMTIALLVMAVSVLLIRLGSEAFYWMPETAETFEESLMVIASVPLLLLSEILRYAVIFTLALPLLLCAVRFYRNLTQDPGYLSFTLPVKPSQHVFCKTFVPLVWTLILAVVRILTGTLVSLIVDGDLTDITGEVLTLSSILKGEGVWLEAWIVLLVVFAFLCLVNTIVMINFSISLGQLFRKHKLIGSILSYLGLSTAFGIFMGSLSIFSISLIDFEATLAGEMLNTYMVSMLSNLSFLTSLICILMYWGCCYIMTKKLNLE